MPDEELTATCAVNADVQAPSGGRCRHAGIDSAGDQTPCDRGTLCPDENTGSSLSRFIGRFEVIQPIAQGGMGVVIKAWDSQIGRYVAIKLLHEHLTEDTDLLQRFHNEAQINGRLEHPSIVSIHEVGKCGAGRPYFVMRLLEGRTLASLLAERETLHSQQLMFLRIFEKIADGVAFAHSRGVIHRDIKPSNIIVGDFGMVKIMDWGLAKSSQSGLHPVRDSAARCESGGNDPDSDPGQTDWGVIVGTPAYMAPEQARGETNTADERLDVFCLGGVLCNILTGSGPYPEEHPSKLIQAMNACLGPAFERLETCPAEQEVIKLAKCCLAPDPANRPRDGREVAQAIAGYLESDMRRAERDLVRFFELSLDLFCIAGLDGYFKRINHNFSRLLGYSEVEMISRPFTDYIHPDDLAATATVMGTLSAGLPVVQFTNRYRHAEGHYLFLEWVAKVEFEEGTNIYAVARDVTNRFQSTGVLSPVSSTAMPLNHSAGVQV